MMQTYEKPNVSNRTQYWRVFLMGISAFVMNTTEFVPVALLSDIAHDFSITTSQTGWMLTIYAWIVAVMSLPLMLMTKYFERKRLLIGIFALFVVSHILSMMAWSFNVLLISRVGVAFAHAIFWSITAAIAIRVAPEGKKALALSVIATGTSMAMVLGVPIGRVIGQWFGWRTTFGSIGLVAFIVLILHARLMPTLPSMFRGSFKKVPELLKKPIVVTLYLLIFLVFTAHYTAYSYIEPFMQQIGNISAHMTTFVLLLFGGAGIIGSVIYSRLGERHDASLMLSSTVIMLVSMLTLLVSVQSIWLLSFNALLWGTALMLLILSIQGKILMIDHHTQDMLMSMFSGIINLGIGAGALIGGYAVTELSLSSIGYVGALVSAMAIVLLLYMMKHWFKLNQYNQH